MNLFDSKTFENIQKAFEGELKASTKYAIYGMKAREDGFEQIGDIFTETSKNEREHAEIWMKLLNNGEVPYTLNNLKDAYTGENYEWTKMYLDFARIARMEGFEEVARLFEGVASIERHHDYRFEELAKNIQRGEVFCKKEEALWICTNCGNLILGKCAPEICPVCGYPQGYYELNCENY